MGWTVQTESHTVELCFARIAEHDQEIHEYYDQPPAIVLRYRTPDGRTVRPVRHTPDYFVLWRDHAGWVECKDDPNLRRLETHNPHRYCCDATGRWRCPPGEEYACTLGLSYQVYCSSAVNWVYQDNLDFLQDYLRASQDLVAEEAAREIQTMVVADPGLSIAQVLRQLDHATADDLYGLIATGRLYVDLEHRRLADRVHAAVYPDATTAQVANVTTSAQIVFHSSLDHVLVMAPNSGICWNGRPWRIVNMGTTHVTVLSEHDEVCEVPNEAFAALFQAGRITRTSVTATAMLPAGQERIAMASTSDRAEANRRSALIAPYLTGKRPLSDVTPERTRQRWLRSWRAAEQAYGTGYVGLLPRRGQQGNRLAKLPVETLALQEEFITTRYETLTQQSLVAVWGLLTKTCTERGLLAPSYTTFRLAVRRRPRDEQTRKRQGQRAASAQEAFYWELTPTLPRHGNRPLAIAHLDHTELDIELVCSQTGRPLGRPWATFLVDAFSRRILAVSLTYQPPSTMSCMMALRICVQRHGRLPQTIVVDGAPEFRSTHFETLLAAYEVTKKTRPWAKPHFGSTCERLVGSTNTRFIHTLVGNTQLMSNVRQVTKSVDPKRQACWTYAEFFAQLGRWAYELYDTTAHAALGQTPREAFQGGEQQSGARVHRRIRYDEDFCLWTLPSTQKGTAMVQSGQGVKINYLTYWCEDFRDPQLVRTRVEVRYDPWDASRAYVYVHGRWVLCVSCYRARFEGRSTTELLLAAEELRQRDRLQARTFPVTAKRLADTLAAIEEHETLLLQHRRDAEMRHVVTSISGTPTVLLLPNGKATPPASERVAGQDETPGVPAPAGEPKRPSPFRRFL
jgi:transposase InsO family protein